MTAPDLGRRVVVVRFELRPDEEGDQPFVDALACAWPRIGNPGESYTIVSDEETRP